MHCIHADPNPGNFIVRDDGKIGLVDFGCVKHFDAEFVDLYGKLSTSAMHGNSDEYMSLFEDLGLANQALDPDIKDRIVRMWHESSRWFATLYQDELFDFKANPDFITSGKRMMRQGFNLMRHMNGNTNFIFLNRTRYGLLRLFEMMGARVSFRNQYEQAS